MTEKPKFLKGQLLLDSGKLQGSFFHRTVILICEHNAEGALGLILNSPSQNKVGEMLVADLPEALKEQTLFVGGPVQPTTLSFLQSDVYLPQANVMTNLNLSHSIEALMESGQSFSTTQQIKIFSGYAGWSPGQLEDEMTRGAWLTHPASLDLIFGAIREKLWKSILVKKGPKYRLLADGPEDLSWN